MLLSCINKSTLPNIVFSDKKKFDVQQNHNPQNDRFWLKSGEIDVRVVTWSHGAASLIVWLAVTETRSLNFLKFRLTLFFLLYFSINICVLYIIVVWLKKVYSFLTCKTTILDFNLSSHFFLSVVR